MDVIVGNFDAEEVKVTGAMKLARATANCCVLFLHVSNFRSVSSHAQAPLPVCHVMWPLVSFLLCHVTVAVRSPHVLSCRVVSCPLVHCHVVPRRQLAPSRFPSPPCGVGAISPEK